MIYLLDTNTCIEYLRAKGNPLVKARLSACPAVDVAVCAVVVGELYYGAERSADPARERAKVSAFLVPFTSLPFDDAAADIFARIRAPLSGLGIGGKPLDLMIAAIALLHGLTLVTHNTKDFTGIPGLTLIDWEAP